MIKMNKKPTAKQLLARKKFAYIMKHGGFKKYKTSSNTVNNLKVKKRIEAKTKKLEKELAKLSRKNFSRVRPNKTRRSRGGSTSDIDKSLLLAIRDPSVKEIIIRK